MRWISGLTREEKLTRLEQWHQWFAWYPVIVGVTPDGRKIRAWMERVERSMIPPPSWLGSGWLKQYRPIEGKGDYHA